MFTWICPKCGSDVPPAYSECPTCASRSAASAQPQAPVAPPQAPPPPPPQAAPPPVASTPAVDPAAASSPFAAPPPIYSPTTLQSRRVSPAVVALLAAVGIVALLGVLYLYVLPHRSVNSAAPATALEQPAAAGAVQHQVHPLAKHLEIAGVRLTESKPQTAKIQLVVINHSAADLPDLKMNVSLRPASGGNPVFEFPLNLASIGPFESREVSTTLKTDLKPYELPDWQFLRPEFRITSEP